MSEFNRMLVVVFTAMLASVVVHYMFSDSNQRVIASILCGMTVAALALRRAARSELDEMKRERDEALAVLDEIYAERAKQSVGPFRDALRRAEKP